MQIIVYAGAMMVLFVFVIMLLNVGLEERTDFSKLAKYAGVPLGFVLLLEIARWLWRSPAGAAVANGPAAADRLFDASSCPSCFSGSICSRLKRPRS